MVHRDRVDLSSASGSGGLKTFGSSDAGDIDVFSVQNDYTSGLFNFGVRYPFWRREGPGNRGCT